jgi:hypothetical protein
VSWEKRCLEEAAEEQQEKQQWDENNGNGAGQHLVSEGQMAQSGIASDVFHFSFL